MKTSNNKKRVHAFNGSAALAIAALLAALFFTACPNTVGGTGTGSGTPTQGGGTTAPGISPDEQWVTDAVNKAGVHPAVIVGTGKKITLGGTDVTWSSNNTAVIDVTNAPSGQYDVTPPAGKTDVTLTAKAVKGSASKERTFTVIVHNDTSTLTAAELIKSLNLPAETETNLTLPATLAGVPGTAITWTSNKTGLIENNGAVHPEKRDLRNQDVTLTATLTYNSTTAHKTFTVALKRLTKIEWTNIYGSTTHTSTWTFTGTEIEHRTEATGSNPSKNGARFSYNNLDTTGKTFTAHRTHQLFEGTWYEIGGAALKAYFMQFLQATEAEYTGYLTWAKIPRTYTYLIDYDASKTVYSFDAEVPYDNSKQWFKQEGYYKMPSNGMPSNEIYFHMTNGKIESFSYNGKRYTGSLNPAGTVFTGTVLGGGDSITVNNIIDNRDKKISIMVGSESYTLNFRGEPLL